MQKHSRNKLMIMILTFVIGLSGTVSASTSNTRSLPHRFDADRTCIITVNTDISQYTPGEKLAIYKVGEVDWSINSLGFTLLKAFEDTHVDLSFSGSTERKEAIEKLDLATETMEPLSEKTITEYGSCQFDVTAGVYLIKQIDPKKSEIQSNLISLPYVNEELSSWSYNIELEPKADVIEGWISIDNNGSGVPTGDDTNTIKYILVGGASTVLLLLLVLLRTRKDEANEKQ